MRKWYKWALIGAAVALPVLAWAGGHADGCWIPGCPCG